MFAKINEDGSTGISNYPSGCWYGSNPYNDAFQALRNENDYDKIIESLEDSLKMLREIRDKNKVIYNGYNLNND